MCHDSPEFDVKSFLCHETCPDIFAIFVYEPT